MPDVSTSGPRPNGDPDAFAACDGAIETDNLIERAGAFGISFTWFLTGGRFRKLSASRLINMVFGRPRAPR